MTADRDQAPALAPRASGAPRRKRIRESAANRTADARDAGQSGRECDEARWFRARAINSCNDAQKSESGRENSVASIQNERIFLNQ
ncbi:MAG: hypothetical protein M5U33_02970 [Pseudorhodoplanes sp.]|nr:hypothetical protein [Pseudorhodoplanes sp.]MCL4709735.1 hypothetical protein [Pseudorhodoplanes sp.]MCZ7641904.1 hypothetical protein [Pseudorhodoplanes sp.]